MKCAKCRGRMVRTTTKPKRYECRNPKCRDLRPKVSADKLFPSLQGRTK